MDEFSQGALIYSILGILLGIGLTLIFFEPGIDEKLYFGSYTPDEIPNSEQEIIDNCKNLDLIETTFCLRDNIETFYYHEPTLESHTDFETLKEIGGDCYNWGIFIKDLAIKLNYDSEMIYVKDNGELRHGFPIISNGEGYCKIDNLKVNCANYGE